MLSGAGIVTVGSAGITVLGTATAGGSQGINKTIAFGATPGLITVPVGSTMQNNGSSLNFTGTAGLTITGGGSVLFQSTLLNNLSGGITISGGSSLDLNYGTTNVYVGDTTIDTNSTLTMTKTISNNGSLTMNANATIQFNAAAGAVVNNLNGASTAVINASSASRTLTVNGGGTWAGSLTQNNNDNGINVLKATGGTLIVTGSLATGANTIAGRGTLTITGGTVSVAQDSNLGGVPTTLAAGIGKITLNGGTLSASASFTMNTNRGLALGPAAGGGTGTIDVGSGAILTYNGAIANTAGGTGNSLAKTGPGTLLLGGANTYDGATNITAGTISVAAAGTINTTSGITLNGVTAGLNYNSATALSQGITFGAGGGTLSGNGTISSTGGVAVANGGIVSPGNSPGQQTYTTGLSFASGTTYLWEHNAGDAVGTAGAPVNGYDQIVINGGSGLTVASGAKLSLNFANTTDFSSPFWDSNQSWTIAAYSSGAATTGTFADANITVNGSVANLSNNSNVVGSEGSFSTALSGNDLVLNWTAASSVPEPASLALLGIGAAALLTRRRR